jgi:hypothetical protein
VEQARSGLQKIVLDVLRGAPPEERVLLAWPVVCGASVAVKTRALGVENGTLRIEVPDRIWRTQLLDLVPHYTAALRGIAGVERIEFILPGMNIQRAPVQDKSGK